MTVQEVIDLASSGELKQVVAKGQTDVLIGHINMGLIELHKRFPLRTREVIITLGVDGNVDNPYTMVNNTEYRLPTDCLTPVSAYGEDGKLLPFNDDTNEFSVYTASWDTVQIPLFETGENVSIIYTVSPTLLTSGDLATELDLPVQLIEALLLYMGFRGHASVNSDLNEENSSFYMRFEKSCNNVNLLGLSPLDSYSRDVGLKGFA